jgi:hypothetical protein
MVCSIRREKKFPSRKGLTMSSLTDNALVEIGSTRDHIPNSPQPTDEVPVRLIYGIACYKKGNEFIPYRYEMPAGLNAQKCLQYMEDMKNENPGWQKAIDEYLSKREQKSLHQPVQQIETSQSRGRGR